MIRTQIYFDEHMHRQLHRLAQLSKKPMAEIVRRFVGEGIAHQQDKLQGNAHILVELTAMAKKAGWTSGLKDLAENHDTYFVTAWEEQERAKH